MLLLSVYTALCNKNVHLAAEDLFNKKKTTILSKNTPSLDCKDWLKQNCSLQKIVCLFQKQMLHYSLENCCSEKCSAGAFEGRHTMRDTCILYMKHCWLNYAVVLNTAISFAAILDIGILFCILNRFHLYSVSPAHPITPKTKSPRHHKKNANPKGVGEDTENWVLSFFLVVFFVP